MKEVKTGRNLIRTTKYYLGMAPISTIAGDEVWILEGKLVPLILRPTVRGRYRVVGETYVHGLMHYDAGTDSENEFQRVVLE
jgi:hypothetical protein